MIRRLAALLIGLPALALAHGGQPSVTALRFPAALPGAVWAVTDNQGVYTWHDRQTAWLCEDAAAPGAGVLDVAVLDGAGQRFLLLTEAGLFATDDPGVDVNVQQGAFTPGNWLRFRPVGQLLYWNGAQWLESTPNGERIEITDALNNAITFHANGVSEIAGVIGEIDSNGGLHEHLNFKILDASNTPNGSPGAYRIQLKLFESTPQSDTSVSIAAAPIAIVLNRGLTSENFESAIVVAAGLDDNAAFVAETGTLTIQRVRAFGAYYKVKLQYNENNQFQLIGAEEITAKD